MAFHESQAFPGDLDSWWLATRSLEATGPRPLGGHIERLRGSGLGPRRLELQLPSLADSIAARLRSSPFVPLRHLTCEEHDGRVVLRGRVPTQYLQALAATVAQSFDNVREVLNRVEVVPLGRPYMQFASVESQPPWHPADAVRIGGIAAAAPSGSEIR